MQQSTKLSKKYPFALVRFADEIVAEVAFPARQTGRVLILCSGAPTSPFKPKALTFWAQHGYVTILPRYRGTWESLGHFLARSPHEDILDIIHAIESEKKILSLRENTWKKITVKKIFLLGGSFGGPAVLLASRHPRVVRAVALAPVIDWRVSGPDEPFSAYKWLSQTAYGGAYRASEKNWEKLERGSFYSPLHESSTINGKKILILHARDDRNVPFETSEHWAKLVQARLIPFKTGGHFGLTKMIQKRYWKHIEPFLKGK